MLSDFEGAETEGIVEKRKYAQVTAALLGKAAREGSLAEHNAARAASASAPPPKKASPPKKAPPPKKAHKEKTSGYKPSSTWNGHECSKADMKEARKFLTYAISSIDYQDAQPAVANMIKAFALLTGREPEV